MKNKRTILTVGFLLIVSFIGILLCNKYTPKKEYKSERENYGINVSNSDSLLWSNGEELLAINYTNDAYAILVNSTYGHRTERFRGYFVEAEEVLYPASFFNYENGSVTGTIPAEQSIWNVNGKYISDFFPMHGTVSNGAVQLSSTFGILRLKLYDQLNRTVSAIEIKDYQFNITGTYNYTPTKVEEAPGIPLTATYFPQLISADRGIYYYPKNFIMELVSNANNAPVLNLTLPDRACSYGCVLNVYFEDGTYVNIDDVTFPGIVANQSSSLVTIDITNYVY